MKKIIFGLLALCIAFSVYAFVKPSTPEKRMTLTQEQQRELRNMMVRQAGRQRFCIMLTCDLQSTRRNQVLDPANYTQTLCPSVECDGSGCVCAIYAFPNGGSGKPIISSSSDLSLYDQLADFAGDGIWDNGHIWVEAKDE